MGHKKKVEVFIVITLQITLLVLFVIFSEYKIKEPDEAKYPMFQDVHVMIFVGFGFLMTFLKRYGYSAVGFNFLLASLTVQWALLCTGFYQLNDNNKIEVGISSLVDADITAAAILISMGALLGRTSYFQLLIMAIIEVPIVASNSYLGLQVFKVSDAGGSIFIHIFGAYFGLAVSFILGRKDKTLEYPLEGSSYSSDLFAMIGTIFLWLYWPSFNAIGLKSHHQHRAIVNTYLSLSSSCVTTFALSQLLTKDHKLDMVHIQNATLAGGVAMGTVANLMVRPFGAIIIGMVAGTISVYGYSKLGPWLSSTFRIRDTCGVNNLHGMPGILAGLIGAIMAAAANEDVYYTSLYEIFPAMAGRNITPTPEFVFLQPGEGRTASQQAGFQLLAVVLTFVIAVTSGLLTGLIINYTKVFSIPPEQYHNDAIFWCLPEEFDSKKNSFVEARHHGVEPASQYTEHI